MFGLEYRYDAISHLSLEVPDNFSSQVNTKYIYFESVSILRKI